MRNFVLGQVFCQLNGADQGPYMLRKRSFSQNEVMNEASKSLISYTTGKFQMNKF